MYLIVKQGFDVATTGALEANHFMQRSMIEGLF